LLPIRLHNGVAVPQHVEPKVFDDPPTIAEFFQRQVLILVGAEAEVCHVQASKSPNRPSGDEQSNAS
jgi:hypothetical protein